MEKMRDIFDGAKERLSNPFVFSFLAAWIVFNWEIVIALVWYDTSQIKAEGYHSIFDLISCKLNASNSVVSPLTAALAYTFAMPIFKLILVGWLTLFHSLEKLLKIYITDYSKKKLDNAEAQSLISNLDNQSILQGKWKRTISSAPGSEQERNIEIKDTFMTFSGDTDPDRTKYIINDFVYNNKNSSVFFSLLQPATNTLFINRLTYSHGNLLKGTELLNGAKYDITYERAR